MPLVRGRKRRSAPEEEAAEAAASSDASDEPSTRRRRVAESDNEVEEADDDGAYGNDEGGGDAESNVRQLVKKMVRLALACEYQRRPIRRSDITEKVLGPHAGRQFRAVFQAAQVELRSVFGMEMVELPNREKVTLAQRRAAAKSQSQASKSTTSYMLISILPSEFRTPDILPPMIGAVAEEEVKYTAAYTLLISLISLSGGSLPDAKMERYLRLLGVQDNAPMGAPGGGSERTEKVLKRMEREGYIVKVKETTGTGEDDIYWTVGPRGKVEVGETGVKGLTKAVYGDLNDDEEEELGRKIARSLGIGQEPPPGATQNATAPKKKRGRKRRGEQEEEEEGGGEGDDDDDEDSDDD